MAGVKLRFSNGAIVSVSKEKADRLMDTGSYTLVRSASKTDDDKPAPAKNTAAKKTTAKKAATKAAPAKDASAADSK